MQKIIRVPEKPQKEVERRKNLIPYLEQAYRDRQERLKQESAAQSKQGHLV